ncbi:MAG: HD-GYP domain-containing protein, partial [Acidobacteria bacterium]|nr:HD-GYP domain-containing protein [Acidobacteriota bacterium]
LPPVARFDAAAEILENQGAYFGMVTVPVLREAELVGYVSAGAKLDFSRASQRMLLKGNRVLASAIPGLTLPETTAASGGISAFETAGRRYVGHSSPRGEYTVVELAEVDEAIAPLLTTLRTALVSMATVSFLVCLVLSFAGTNALSRPLREFSELLAKASPAGVLPSELPSDGGVTEMRQFKRSFQEAARAVSRSRDELEQAYIHFMEAMAEALDARDAYTAGHSRRVSDYSVAIAQALALPADQVERLRIGAMLHDIGKIGIPDSVLLKHDRLTAEEFAVIREHPVIGRRILERIGRFQPFLAAVELHHENHDGTGYPHRLRGEEIPLEARIVHVADAYDAMTSNRPYRERMPEEKVRRILTECAGTQFDPHIVDAFLGLPGEVLLGISKDLEKLSHAIRSAPGPAAVAQPSRDGVPVAGTRV